MNHVLDASAMLALLRAETGGQIVRDLLADPDATCLAHVVNLLEVYYVQYRRSGEAAARLAMDNLLATALGVREDLDRSFWQQVGQLKAQHSTSQHSVSIADCFAIALTQRVDGALLTTDHSEMDPLVPLNLCRIRFIR